MLQLLSPERVAIASTELDQHVEDSVELNSTLDLATEDSNEVLSATQDGAISQSNTIAPETLKKFRRGYGEHAAQATQQLKEIAVTSAEGILCKARLLLDMKLSLNRKEWGVWLREVLGWFGSEATPYLQIGKVFKDFDPSVFRELEPFTILKLRTKRYAPVVTRLREELAITSDLIQNFIKEVIPKQPRRKKAAPNYGEAVLKQRVNAEDGTFYFTLNANLGDTPGSWLEAKLDNCTVGQVLEQAAAWEQQNEDRRHDLREGLEAEVEQRVRNRVEMFEFALKQEIAELKTQLQTSANPSHLVEQTMASTAQQSSEQKEAIALRTQQKSPARPSKDRTTHPEEVNAVVDDARPLFSQNSNEGEELPKSDHTGAKFEERPTIVVAAAEDESAPASDEMGKNLETQVVALATAPAEAPAQPPETVQEIVCPKPSDNTSAADHQLITSAWDVLKQLRDAEGYVQLVESQIHELNSKLAKPSLDRIVERELKDVLKNRQNLRINKISQIISLADSNGIPADYEQLKSNGRIVLAPEYASEALKQAKSWKDVVLLVAGDRDQLIKAVDSWTIEQRQILVQLLSTYLKTEPSGLEHVAWIPKTLLQKALTTLSFKIRKIGGPNNLVDDPKIEYVSNCNFISLEYPGTTREQWIFQDKDNKRHSVFGRDEIEIEKF